MQRREALKLMAAAPLVPLLPVESLEERKLRIMAKNPCWYYGPVPEWTFYTEYLDDEWMPGERLFVIKNGYTYCDCCLVNCYSIWNDCHGLNAGDEHLDYIVRQVEHKGLFFYTMPPGPKICTVTFHEKRRLFHFVDFLRKGERRKQGYSNDPQYFNPSKYA